MIRISKICLVDGVEINISAEGGSAKEALSYVENACDELGAAPGGVPTSGAKRTRRTKAEMEAARTAASELGSPTKMIDANTMEEIKDPEPPHGVPVSYEPSATTLPPTSNFVAQLEKNASVGTTTMFGPDPSALFPLPSGATAAYENNVITNAGSATVRVDPAPPLPQGIRSVELEPPPFEIPTPEQNARDGIVATLEETRRLAPQWSKAIEENYTRTVAPFGGDIFAMHLEGLDATLKGVASYRDRVKAHLGVK